MSTEQHEAFRYAEILEANARSGNVTDSDDERKTAAMLRASHALIVQMHRAMTTGESFSEAIVDAEKFLKGPKT